MGDSAALGDPRVSVNKLIRDAMFLLVLVVALVARADRDEHYDFVPDADVGGHDLEVCARFSVRLPRSPGKRGLFAVQSGQHRFLSLDGCRTACLQKDDCHVRTCLR